MRHNTHQGHGDNVGGCGGVEATCGLVAKQDLQIEGCREGLFAMHEDPPDHTSGKPPMIARPQTAGHSKRKEHAQLRLMSTGRLVSTRNFKLISKPSCPRSSADARPLPLSEGFGPTDSVRAGFARL